MGDPIDRRLQSRGWQNAEVLDLCKSLLSNIRLRLVEVLKAFDPGFGNFWQFDFHKQ